MKTAAVIALVLVLGFTQAQGQEKYIARGGHIWFYSHTPFEDIEAHNNEVASVLTPSTGDMVFQVLNKSFRFKRALMEEHFNENYMESAKYPKAEFKGKITNLGEVNFAKDGTYNAVVEGTLSIHGKTNRIKQTGAIEVKDGKIMARSKFEVVPQDYGIEIPAAVRDKFAKSMTVNVDMTYEPYRK